MKNRLLSLILIILMAFASLIPFTACDMLAPPSGGGACADCVDSDGDGVCDVCGENTDSECSHTDAEPRNHICDICGEVLGECMPAPGSHACDICGKTVSVCADDDGDGICDTCRTKMCDCADRDPLDHKCDVCGTVMSVCKDEEPADHLCDICGTDLGDCIDISPEDHYCDVCGELLSYEIPALTKSPLDISSLPAYSEDKYIVINNNIPEFAEYQLAEESYEYYGARDALGRCTVAVALIGKDLMPTEERGNISSVYPTGWHSSSIYERCHLIAFSLTGENANYENLITGTYDLNEVMQSFEAMVCSYIKETSNHVLYRVVPVFEGDNLLASGVQIEAYSVEDGGDGICFNIYIYNAEVDYDIDYSNGDAKLSDESELNNCTFVINKRNGKFHLPTCSSVTDMADDNKLYSYETYETLIADGYSPCGNCLKNYAP